MNEPIVNMDAAVRLGAFARQDNAGAPAPVWLAPTPRVALTDRQVPDVQIGRMLLHADPAVRRAGFNALNDRMQRAGDLVTGGNTVHLSNTPSNFPDQKHQGIPTAIYIGDAERQMVDLRWTPLFTIQDRRGESHPYFKIVDSFTNVAVRRYLIGERIEVGSPEAEEAIYEAYIYALGLQWNRLQMEWQDAWSVARGMAAMQVKYANFQAKTAYETITAASGIDTISYDATGSNQVAKDINTINAAQLDLRKDLYDATSTVGGTQTEEVLGDGQSFYLLYNNNTAGYQARIRNALLAGPTLPNDNFSVTSLDFPIQAIGSPYVATGAWYLVLPGRKNILSVYRDLRMYPFEDVRNAGISEGEVGQGSYRFVRGDAKQVKKVSVS